MRTVLVTQVFSQDPNTRISSLGSSNTSWSDALGVAARPVKRGSSSLHAQFFYRWSTHDQPITTSNTEAICS
ncbi:hypothetical protein PtB15_1B852 [Puccinia triticina]|nr:hypothetical protein PtB15_1B852 [Puccinia triticina]